MVSKKLTALLTVSLVGLTASIIMASPPQNRGIALAGDKAASLSHSELIYNAKRIVAALGRLPQSEPDVSPKKFSGNNNVTALEWLDGPTISLLDDGTLILYSNPEFEGGRAQVEDVGQINYELNLEKLKSQGMKLAKMLFGQSARIRSATWSQPAIIPNPTKVYVEHLTLMIDELPEGLKFPTQGASAAITLNSNGQVVSIGASWINRKINAKQNLSLDAAIQESKRFLKSKDISDISIDPKTCGLGYVAPGKYLDAENHKQTNRRNVRLAWRIPFGGQREIWIDAESGLIVGGKK